MDIQDRVVIITGASMGIGAATARAFVAAGAKVVLAARSVEPLAALEAELGHERALAVPTDITDRAQVEALVRRALERFGAIDILVNNAGVGMSGPVATLRPELFQEIFAINVVGPLYAMQAAIPHLRKPGGGLIINVSSMVSKLPIPTIGGYRATKTALDALSANARIELARDHIRVITVLPGQTDTDFFKNSRGSTRRAGYQPRRADPPELVAQRIVAGARHEPREVFMNGRLRFATLLTALAPGLMERIFARVVRRASDSE